MDKLNLKSATEQLSNIAEVLSRYKAIVFIIFIVGIYGFVVMRINSLDNVQPSANTVASQPNAIKAAHIDKAVVRQLQSLRDNSVNVQTLFEQARNNPFQE